MTAVGTSLEHEAIGGEQVVLTTLVDYSQIPVPLGLVIGETV